MDYLDQIKKENEEVLKFLVKNKKELQGTEFTIWKRKKYKDSTALVKELIKLSKNPAIEFKIGINGNFIYRRQSDMESALKKGNVKSIDIETTNKDIQGRAIKKFGTSS